MSKFTTEQKLAALRSIHRPSTTMTAAIIADYETHIPALVAVVNKVLDNDLLSSGHLRTINRIDARAALAHFTEAGGQVQCAACGKQSPVETVQYNRCPECGEPFEAGGQGGENV